MKESMVRLRARFEMKHWSVLADCVRVISTDVENATISASDPLIEAAAKGTCSFKMDFIRALRASIDESCRNWMAAIPKEVGPSNEAMATLANVLLDLPAEEVLDATYRKNLHCRDWEQGVAD